MMMQSLTAAQIPCCICGTMIYPNAANQCTTCLSQDFNLQDYIQRPSSSATGNINNSTDDRNKIVIYQCLNCRRFQRTEKCWDHADHESSQLMSICLKHIPALQHNHHHATSTHSTTAPVSASSTSLSIGPLRLMDAQWIWTEPHCMRYKIRCTIQTEVHNVRVQQRVLVLIHCEFKMCIDCTREFNHRTWQSVVQLRQKLSSEQSSSGSTSSKTTEQSHRNGLLILEQAMAKNKEIRKHVLKIDQVTNMGYDFYFISIPHAHTFVSFLQRIIPMRVRTSKKLVSTDAHSNVANMKHTMICDMVPFNVNDLIVIYKSTTKCKLSGHLVLVTKLASVIHFINAAPQRQRLIIQPKSNTTTSTVTGNTSNSSSSMIDDCIMESSAETYYKQGGEKQYRVLQSSHRLIRFVVLDVELLVYHDTNETTTTSTTTSSSSSVTNTEQKQQYAMADVLVARESDMGTNDRTYTTISHLGRQIEAGDVVLGYDLTSSSFNLDDDDMSDNFYNNFTMPDIVLVKKASSIPADTAIRNSGDKNKSWSKSDKKSSSRNNKKDDKEKKQTQRRRRNDGKRSRELEERAKRMGFIPEESVDVAIDDDGGATARVETNNNNDEDSYDDENSTVPIDLSNKNNDGDDYDMIYDANLGEEVLAFEREFESLDLQQQHQHHDSNDDVQEVDIGNDDDDDRYDRQ